ncbi:hypothetical protein FNV65_35285 [Streptomyces sp. S1A1-8]|uniref:hypothetical protein n=1 Tax=unclassified Streptomyces TaxID=2593676 RepID=UPI0011628FD7|nr:MULTISPECIES: hypothetical protein [unclassified Streptomyces]QDO00776.1 hypothetical protein FNV58_36705 [Streptomyces sp. RLB1-9]QDO22506.1 hypothetical protein FNV65_35285 [Streptomyces sp. S1A1-8]QDO32633.1 hypothetical protein FNV63_35305 [Streptomyces sp. S1A1-3]
MPQPALLDTEIAPEQMPGAVRYQAADIAAYGRALAGDGYTWLTRILPPPVALACPRCRRPMHLGTVPLLWECLPCDGNDARRDTA